MNITWCTRVAAVVLIVESRPLDQELEQGGLGCVNNPDLQSSRRETGSIFSHLVS